MGRWLAATNLTKLRTGLLLLGAVLVAVACWLVFVRLQPPAPSDKKNTAINNVQLQPADTTHGETLASVHLTDTAKQVAFLQAAGRKYHIDPPPGTADPTGFTPAPEVVVNACLRQEITDFQNYAMSPDASGLSREKRLESLRGIRQYCFKTYSADGQVPPEPPERDPHHMH